MLVGHYYLMMMDRLLKVAFQRKMLVGTIRATLVEKQKIITLQEEIHNLIVFIHQIIEIIHLRKNKIFLERR